MYDPEEQELRQAFADAAVEKFRDVHETLLRAIAAVEAGDILLGLRVLSETNKVLLAHGVMYASLAAEFDFITMEGGKEAIEQGAIDAAVATADFENVTPADFE